MNIWYLNSDLIISRTWDYIDGYTGGAGVEQPHYERGDQMGYRSLTKQSCSLLKDRPGHIAWIKLESAKAPMAILNATGVSYGLYGGAVTSHRLWGATKEKNLRKQTTIII